MAEDPKDSKPPAPQASSEQAGDDKKPPAQAGDQPPAQGAGAQQPPSDKSSGPPAQKGTGQLGKRTTHFFTIPPHPKTQFDEENFLTLLESSISLTLEEKKRVIEAIPRLSIEQINELIKIFEEEKQKFSELESEFSDDVSKLKKEREREFETSEAKEEEETESIADVEEAEKLKKKLGL